MKTMWIDGNEYPVTPRQELRIYVNAGWTMDMIDRAAQRGQISQAAHRRYTRLWIWATATDHPATRHVPVKRWGDRREWIRRVIRSMPGNDVVTSQITGNDMSGRHLAPCAL